MVTPSHEPVEELNRPTERPKIPRIKIDKKYNKLEVLKVEYVKTDSIFPNAYNPNRQSEREFDLLMKSISEDGFTQPVVVHRKSKQIVDGEHRWRAANRLHMDTLPVVFVDMSADQMRISTLRHNRARGSEDVELTVKILQDLRNLGALEHAMDSLGIEEKEMNLLIDDLPAPEAMGADSFGTAWVPSNIAPAPITEYKKQGEVHTSAAVITQREDLQERMEGASTFTQMGDVSKSVNVEFQLMSITVTGPEAKTIREILGKDPVTKFMHMCSLKVVENPEMLGFLVEQEQFRSFYRKAMETHLGHTPQIFIDQA